MNFKLYPSNKESVYKEIIKLFDAYDNDYINDDVLNEYLNHYQKNIGLGNYETNINQMEEPFYASSFTRKRIGLNRTRRLEQILTKPLILE
jgi:hypothetical protein